MARAGLVLAMLLALAAPGHAQTFSKLQSAGTPQARIDVGAGAGQAGGAAGEAAPLTTLDPYYQLRAAPGCADFKRVDGGWSALAAIEFPGPRGPVKMLGGQTISPGGYLDGMDLGAMLDRDCANVAIDRSPTSSTPGSP